MQQFGPWKIISSRDVYQDPWLLVRRDEVIRPDGHLGSYATVHIKRGVSVLAMDERQHVYLTSEFHYAVGRITLEVVSGGIDEDETAEQAALRELKEELGIDASKLTELGTVDPFTASINSPTKLFLAEQLTHGQASQEGTELITVTKLSLEDAYRAVMSGKITHAPSCTLILMAVCKLTEKTRPFF
jgi:ADP-ribose pyrophosphatase